jgi:hypothetical protein
MSPPVVVPSPPLRKLLLLVVVAIASGAAAGGSLLLGEGLRLEGARAALGSALDAYSTAATAGGAGASSFSSSALDRAPFADKMWHGTTTCAFVFDHGILVAVDSRASMGEWHWWKSWSSSSRRRRERALHTLARSARFTHAHQSLTHRRKLHWVWGDGEGAAGEPPHPGHYGGRGGGLRLLDPAPRHAGHSAGRQGLALGPGAGCVLD